MDPLFREYVDVANKEKDIMRARIAALESESAQYREAAEKAREGEAAAMALVLNHEGHIERLREENHRQVVQISIHENEIASLLRARPDDGRVERVRDVILEFGLARRVVCEDVQFTQPMTRDAALDLARAVLVAADGAERGGR